MDPRFASRIGYIALAVVTCVSETTHLPETPFVLAFAIGFAVARFGPPALEHVRGRAFTDPVAFFVTIASASLVAECLRVVLETSGTSPAQAQTIERVALALFYAYVWEIAYDLGGPRKKPSLRRASDAALRLAARVHAVHAAA